MNNDHIIQVGIWYVEQFEKDNVFFVECLIKFATIRKVMIMVYNALVKDKKIQAIEKLERDTKVNFWSDAKDFSAGRLSNNEAIELSKILYVLKVL